MEDKTKVIVDKLKSEKADLDTKIVNLKSFISNDRKFDNIRPTQQILLCRQYNAMINYSTTLEERIDDLEEHGTEK